MRLGTLLLVAAAALAWLSQDARVTPLRQLEDAVGFPVWPALAVVGAAMVMRALLGRAPAPRPRQRAVAVPPPRQETDGPVGTGAWLAAAEARARGLALGRHGKVRVRDAEGVPFTLVLRADTETQASTTLGVFAEFLHSVPRPPRVRVRLDQSPKLEGPLPHLAKEAFSRYFPVWELRVSTRPYGVEVEFERADPGWG